MDVHQKIWHLVNFNIGPVFEFFRKTIPNYLLRYFTWELFYGTASIIIYNSKYFSNIEKLSSRISLRINEIYLPPKTAF